MKAKKLPSGNYRAIAYLGKDANGNQIRKSFTSPDPAHAVALAAAYKDQHRVRSERGSLSSVMVQFFRDKEPYLSPTTFGDYKSRSKMLNKYYPWLCRKNIYTISAEDIRRLTTDMISIRPPRHKNNTESKALRPKTVKNYLIFLHSVFSYAGCPFPAYELPKREQSDIYVPTDAEMRTLVATARDTTLYVPVLLAAFGPLRRGEICALSYPRDFNGDVIHVRQSVAKKGKKFVRKDPKTVESDRFIQMPSWVISEIESAGKVTDLDPNQITRRFPHLLKKAGLPDFRFHDLRHYCVSTLHAQGVPDAYIMQRGGWATDSVLKKVYRHIMADQLQVNTQKALAHFDNIFFDPACALFVEK